MSFANLVAAMDRAAQANLGSVAVIYQPALGAPVEVRGMFDDPFVLLDEGHAGMEQRGPQVFLRLSDLPTDPMVTSPILTIVGLDYQVVGHDDDGMGGVTLKLQLVD